MTRHPRRSLVFAILGNAAAPIAAFAAAPILAQSLGVAGRGEVATGTAPLMLAASAATLGLPEAITYFAAKQRLASQRRNMVVASMALSAIGIAVSILFFWIAPALSGGSEHTSALIRLSILMLVPSLLLVLLRGLAAGRNRWGLIAVERTFGSIFRLVAVIALAFTGHLDTVSATVTISASMWVGAAVYIALIARSRDSLIAAENHPLELLHYGSRLWLGSLAGILLARLDQLLVTPLSTVSELGLYVTAVSIAELVLVFNNAVRDVYFAEESRSPDTDRLTSAARVSTLATLVAAVSIGIGSYWLLPILFGEDFGAAYVPLLILLFGIVAGNPGSIAGAGLSGRGYPGLRSWSLVIAVVINVAAVVILTPALGAVGAAIATCFGNITACGFNLFWLRRKFDISPSSFIFIRRDDLVALRAVIVGILGRRP
ncbi:lipopolysaccharide biosynthesis protein [Herbiconiux sp. P16]|uniref:lipopolysaccharide biosynthesis protein n=1 Tax=Herbiconiux wuyangfengii TaxID=3342794 RepID=UPI0035B73840